jgi:hypothetical protein
MRSGQDFNNGIIQKCRPARTFWEDAMNIIIFGVGAIFGAVVMFGAIAVVAVLGYGNR